MQGLGRYEGLFEQVLGYVGLADLAVGLAFLAMAGAFIIYRARIVAVVGSPTFVAALVGFALAQGCAHLWNAFAGETATWVRRALDSLAVATAILLATMLPRALARLGLLSEAARRAAEAEARVKVRDEFLSVAAHELKTPVTSIAGFGQLLAQLIESGEAERDPMSVLRRVRVQQESIKRLTQLIDQLLDYSRVERGALRLELKDVDFVRLVHDAARDVEYRRGVGRIRISGPPEAVVPADASRMYQVLVNLLDNAAKYSSGPIDVTVMPDEADGLAVAVRDYGPGIAEELLPHLFTPFKRAADTYVEGLGLGLAISKNIVELHHGSVTVRTAHTTGAEFRCWIPSHVPAHGAGTTP